MPEYITDAQPDIQNRFAALARNLGRVLDIGDDALIAEAEQAYCAYLQENSELIAKLQARTESN